MNSAVVHATVALTLCVPLPAHAALQAGTITYVRQAGPACSLGDGGKQAIRLLKPDVKTAAWVVLTEDGHAYLIQRPGSTVTTDYSLPILETTDAVESDRGTVLSVKGTASGSIVSCRPLEAKLETAATFQSEPNSEQLKLHLLGSAALLDAEDLQTRGQYADSLSRAKVAVESLKLAGAGSIADRNASRVWGGMEAARGDYGAGVKILEAACVEPSSAGNISTILCRGELAGALPFAGQTARAADMAKENLDAAVATPELAAHERVRIRAQYADSLRQRGRREEALVEGQKAVVEAEQAYGEEHSVLGRALAVVALVQYESSDLTCAASAERALRIHEMTLAPKHPRTYSAMGITAIAYREAGRLFEALPIGEAAYRGLTETLGPSHPNTLGTMINVGALYQLLGRDREALAMYMAAEEGFRTRFSPTHPGRLIAWRNQAGIYRNLGDPASALEIDVQLLKLVSQAFGEQHLHTVIQYVDVGRDLRQLGRLDEAVPQLQQGIERATKALGPTHGETLVARMELVRAYRDQGQFDAAIAEGVEVYALAVAVHSESNFDAIKAGSLLSDVYEKAGKRHEATTTLEKSIAIVEDARATQGLSPAFRQSFLSIHVKGYRTLAMFYLESGRIEDFFRLIELTKSRTLVESLSARRAEELGGLSTQERERVMALQAQITELDAKASGSSPADQLLIGAQRGELVAELDKLRADLRKRYPRYARLENRPLETTGSARKLVEPGTVLVDYAIVDRKIAAITITRDGVKLHDLGTEKGIADAVVAYRALLLRTADTRVWRLGDGSYRASVDPPEPAATPVSSVDEVAGHLAKRLLIPLRPVLRRYRTWLIVPDGELALLPLEALSLDGHLVVERHDVGYIASVSLLALLRDRKARGRAAESTNELLAVGAPNYGQATTTPQTETALQFRSLGVSWDPLPGSLREVNEVARGFPGSKTLLLTGDDASEYRVSELNRSGQLKSFRYLHFATHGYLSTTSPDLSAVVLSQVNNPKGFDGYITAAEWVGYDLDSDLMVVSACNTGVGERVQGEGVMGLPYALVIAGNRSTMLTLWPVVDSSTAQLMVSVFDGIRAGLSPGKALAEAKRQLARRPATANPLHWAAFIYYGS